MLPNDEGIAEGHLSECEAENESLRLAAGALETLLATIRQELAETESTLAASEAENERLRAALEAICDKVGFLPSGFYVKTAREALGRDYGDQE